MLVEEVQTITKNENEEFCYPQYRANCISNIPDLLKDIFEVQSKTPKTLFENLAENACLERDKKVILLVIDCFGFNRFLKYCKQNQFLRKLSNKGVVQPLTSVFPSQTTNALTTLNTGLTPQEHGLFEYFIYLKNIGVVNALRFERISCKRQIALMDEGFEPSSLMLKGESIHSTLKERGIGTFTTSTQPTHSTPAPN